MGSRSIRRSILSIASLVTIVVAAAVSPSGYVPSSGQDALERADVGGEYPQQERYPSPQRRTEGSYHPPAYSAAERSRGAKEADKENARDWFSGEINDVYLVAQQSRYPANPESYGRHRCSSEEMVVEYREIPDTSELRIRPAYLPPGTFEIVKPRWSSCWTTDEGVSAERMFHFGEDEGPDAFVEIGRYTGPRVVWIGPTSSPRVTRGSVAGRSAVLVQPLTSAGWGSSYVIVPESFGFTLVHGFAVPMQQVLRIAEGIYA